VVRCCDATASSFLRRSSRRFFAHFHAVTVACGIYCLPCQDELFANNRLEVHAFDFALHLSRLFRSALNQACRLNTRVRLMLSSPNACLIFARVSVAFSRKCLQNLMLFLCRIHCEIVSFIFFTARGLLSPRPVPKLEDIPCRLSTAAYSVYSQLPSSAGLRLLHPQFKDAPFRGDKRPT
jgi:hypothetical protein